ARTALLQWLVAFALVLPLIRFVGEADEHDYEATTESAATFSSLGRLQRLLFHPHGDGYHAEHHRYPPIPHHHLRRMRSTLLVIDPYWIYSPAHDGVLK